MMHLALMVLAPRLARVLMSPAFGTWEFWGKSQQQDGEDDPVKESWGFPVQR